MSVATCLYNCNLVLSNIFNYIKQVVMDTIFTLVHVGCHLSIHPFKLSLLKLDNSQSPIFQQLYMHAHVHHHLQERSNEPMNGSFCLVLANFLSLKYFHILDASKCKDTQI